jgi:hypothetical protein
MYMIVISADGFKQNGERNGSDLIAFNRGIECPFCVLRSGE